MLTMIIELKLLIFQIIFYNNDFSKRLRIVLEGINEEGKLIHIEKILE